MQRVNIKILASFVCFCGYSKPHAARNAPAPKGPGYGYESCGTGWVATNAKGDHRVFAAFVRFCGYSVVYDENA